MLSRSKNNQIHLRQRVSSVVEQLPTNPKVCSSTRTKFHAVVMDYDETFFIYIFPGPSTPSKRL